MSTVGLVALAQQWLAVEAVCRASVTDMVIHCRDSATIKQASAIVLTIPMEYTASSACLATMETHGETPALFLFFVFLNEYVY